MIKGQPKPRCHAKMSIFPLRQRATSSSSTGELPRIWNTTEIMMKILNDCFQTKSENLLRYEPLQVPLRQSYLPVAIAELWVFFHSCQLNSFRSKTPEGSYLVKFWSWLTSFSYFFGLTQFYWVLLTWLANLVMTVVGISNLWKRSSIKTKFAQGAWLLRNYCWNGIAMGLNRSLK